MMGAIERACSVAFSVRAALALAVSFAVPARLPFAFREPCSLQGGYVAGGDHARLQLNHGHHALQEKATRGALDLREIAEAHIKPSEDSR
jgi:hypothetical protein